MWSFLIYHIWCIPLWFAEVFEKNFFLIHLRLQFKRILVLPEFEVLWEWLAPFLYYANIHTHIYVFPLRNASIHRGIV